MANRLIGRLPKIGIRLVIDGREDGVMDTNPHMPKAIWGFNGTERPGAVYQAAALAGYTQKGLPVFCIYSEVIMKVLTSGPAGAMTHYINKFKLSRYEKR